MADHTSLLPLYCHGWIDQTNIDSCPSCCLIPSTALLPFFLPTFFDSPCLISSFTSPYPIKPNYPFPCSMLVHLGMYVPLNALNVKIAPKLCGASGHSYVSMRFEDLEKFHVIYQILKLELTLWGCTIDICHLFCC